VARAFEEYHGERRGNWACYCQAVNILIKAGPLADFDGVDLLKFESQRKWEASPATSSASLAWDERAPREAVLPLGAERFQCGLRLAAGIRTPFEETTGEIVRHDQDSSITSEPRPVNKIIFYSMGASRFCGFVRERASLSLRNAARFASVIQAPLRRVGFFGQSRQTGGLFRSSIPDVR